jgi:hypothetical protein
MKLSDLNDLPQIATRAEYAKHIGCSTRTLLRAEKKGEIEGIRAEKNQVYYHRQDVLALLLQKGLL